MLPQCGLNCSDPLNIADYQSPIFHQLGNLHHAWISLLIEDVGDMLTKCQKFWYKSVNRNLFKLQDLFCIRRIYQGISTKIRPFFLFVAFFSFCWEESHKNMHTLGVSFLALRWGTLCTYFQHVTDKLEMCCVSILQLTYQHLI